MKSRSLLATSILLVVTLSSLSFGQPVTKISHFEKEWQKVDSLTGLGLPKSALEIVNSIYTRSKKEKNNPQYIKAVIYKLKLQSDFREDAMLRSIYELKNEIDGSQKPVTQVLTSMLAELYLQYYQNNLWRFSSRSTVAGNPGDSIQTWDLNVIIATINRTYLISLQDPDLLKSIPISEYEEILVNNRFQEPSNIDIRKSKGKSDVKNPVSFRPTLFDFLSWRALDYFTGGTEAKNQSFSVFKLDNPSFLLPASEWIKINPARFDSASPESHAIRLFRDLAIFHVNDKDPRALIDEEVKRLNYVHEQGVFDYKDSLYIQALKRLEQVYISSSWSTDISFALASFLENKSIINDQELTADLFFTLESFPENTGKSSEAPATKLHKWDLKDAIAICEAAIARFPESEGAAKCRNLIKRIMAKSLIITLEEAVVPEKESLGQVKFKNIQKLWFRLIKADPETINEKIAGFSMEERTKYFTSQTVLKTWNLALPSDGDLKSHTAEFIIPALPAGFYYLIASSDEKFSDSLQAITWASFFSTQISYISQDQTDHQDNRTSFYLLDRETGKPLKNLTAEAFLKKYDYTLRKYRNEKIGTFKSDENGFFSIQVEKRENFNNFFLRISMKNDLFLSGNFFMNSGYDQKEISIHTSFFMDRAIYRPGQTIYFKGITIKKSGDRNEIQPGKVIDVTFMDANSQKVAQQTFTTNEFGSFNGSFTAPASGLTGRMSLSASSGSIGFSVEEYKRPTFEVTFDPAKGNYRLNDSIRITGKAMAYAGNAISGANVKFRVVRHATFPYRDRWWFPFPESPKIEMANGSVTTETDGSFTFTFLARPDLSIGKETNPVFNYALTADVTDLNGETRSAENSVAVGYTSLLIGLNIPELMNRAADTAFRLVTTNLNLQKTAASVSIVIQRLRQPDRVLKKRKWSRPDIQLMSREDFHSHFPYDIYDDEDISGKWPVESTLFEKTMDSGKDSILYLKDLSGMTPGSYRLILKSVDPYGKPVERMDHFTVFDPQAKEMPVNELGWFVPLTTSAEPGQKAAFLIGSKEEDVNVMYEFYVHDSLYSRQWIKLNDQQKLIEIPVQEGFRGNFSVNFAFVKHNRAFQYSALVTVPYTNKKLDIKFETFRNKLYPGQQEEWKIKITNAANKGAEAEFMAAMYDASLDVFSPNRWNEFVSWPWYNNKPWTINSGFRTSTGASYTAFPFEPEPITRYYDELNWFGFGSSRRGGRFMMVKSMTMDNAVPQEMAENSTNATGMNEPELLPPPSPSESVLPEITRNSTPVRVRTDFRETAFFYPSLVTDREGDLILKFTVPESLTQWKMMGLAHTKDLETGLITKELVTQKDLMVFPNTPRFVRQGDTLVFSTKVVNLSDRALNGEVMLELTNGITQEPVKLILQENADLQDKKTENFTIPIGQSVAFNWKLAIPVDASLSLLQYRITARSGNFSDGEEKAIPVLTNRMLVTESLPMPVRGSGSFDFDLEKLSKSKPGQSLKNYRLTLEFASNPVWYAIQALPALDEPQYPSADNIFNAFYANSIASFIANSNPKIQKVFESWKNLTPEALLSNLEKNEELKSALLQETPWVMEAKDESQRKQRIGRLFDMNTLSNRLDASLNRLRKMQKPGGGWPWMEGMEESRYITQRIVTGLAHLDHLGVRNIRDDNETWTMVTSAIRFIDDEMVKEYSNLKKYYPDKMKENHLNGSAIQYLYARSYFLKDLPVNAGKDAKTQEAFLYFQNQEITYWLQQDLYFQGMIALALNRIGNKGIPQQILKSLSEKALHSPEMGMYWTLSSGYSWNEAPVETQALLMEAFDEINADPKSLEEMKIWLLKQKQTRDWKTTSATADACYALLLRGLDLLSADPQVKFKVGTQEIDPKNLPGAKAEAGTGYFKISWNGSEIKPEMGKVTVSKTGDGIAWGALYWQYFEDLDKITMAQTPLKLEKKVFIEKNTPSGPVLEQISNLAPLKTGDKLKVRIILTCDREMDYVHLKDMRASAFEPVVSSTLSGYRYQDGLGYYQSTTDAATHFFFDHLRKGTFVFEYPLLVNAAGEYSNGITTIQCMYAPEFGAHSEGIRVEIK